MSSSIRLQFSELDTHHAGGLCMLDPSRQGLFTVVKDRLNFQKLPKPWGAVELTKEGIIVAKTKTNGRSPDWIFRNGESYECGVPLDAGSQYWVEEDDLVCPRGGNLKVLDCFDINASDLSLHHSGRFSRSKPKSSQRGPESLTFTTGEVTTFDTEEKTLVFPNGQRYALVQSKLKPMVVFEDEDQLLAFIPRDICQLWICSSDGVCRQRIKLPSKAELYTAISWHHHWIFVEDNEECVDIVDYNKGLVVTEIDWELIPHKSADERGLRED